MCFEFGSSEKRLFFDYRVGRIWDVREREDFRMIFRFWREQLKRGRFIRWDGKDYKRIRIWMNGYEIYFGQVKFEMGILYVSRDLSRKLVSEAGDEKRGLSWSYKFEGYQRLDGMQSYENG